MPRVETGPLDRAPKHERWLAPLTPTEIKIAVAAAAAGLVYSLAGGPSVIVALKNFTEVLSSVLQH